MTRNKLFEYQELVRNTPVADNVIEYVVDLVKQTRPQDQSSKISQWLDWGAGPRASTHLILAAKAKTLIHNSENTIVLFYCFIILFIRSRYYY